MVLVLVLLPIGRAPNLPSPHPHMSPYMAHIATLSFTRERVDGPTRTRGMEIVGDTPSYLLVTMEYEVILRARLSEQVCLLYPDMFVSEREFC